MMVLALATYFRNIWEYIFQRGLSGVVVGVAVGSHDGRQCGIWRYFTGTRLVENEQMDGAPTRING